MDVTNTTNVVRGPFTKGVSGNPAGRPKGRIELKARLRQLMKTKIRLKDPLIGKVTTASAIDHMLARLIAMGLQGNLQAMKEIFDRVDLKKQSNTENGVEVTMTGANGESTTIRMLPKEQADAIINARYDDDDTV